LSVAGLDGSGESRAAADVKVFQAVGSYGMGLAAVFDGAEHQGLSASLPVEPSTLERQLEAISPKHCGGT
jgi:hydroxymethylpyrimidine/phosphomethylpyrimidine kinase